ncbi:hypothetical protein CWB41_13955 [Methylovirgula ligni]|uniref:hypothetical protein n=1 Tax=Methylovirgula ligni TaxID=569860 RepID=UPI000E23131B|nr:hypothetical protein [Methylovirgula ligni]QAY96697.1 hypothetical protein CWB41_13955 [Methylovirgula ligni]
MRDSSKPSRLRRLFRWLDDTSRELMLLTGLGILAGGLWQVYRPAALIVPGVVLISVAIFGVAPFPGRQTPPETGE